MDLIKAIELAIIDEKLAQEKYRAAAEAADDSETKLMLQQMVREEEQHERRLTERLKALKLLKNP